ncbi:protein S-acyltransferase [Malassezia sp. CBS 17886]|nr:protein S-acyltransferase [Malassezia sp. CBS 17886]
MASVAEPRKPRARAPSCVGMRTRMKVEHENTRAPQPDPWWMQYAIVLVLWVIILWTCAVYLWRICYPMLVRRPSAVGSRATGIVLLVIFCVLWILLVWSYAAVVLSKPGYVRDVIPRTGLHTLETPEMMQRATGPAPIPASSQSPHSYKSTPDNDVSSVRNMQPFSPLEEREQRWAAIDEENYHLFFNVIVWGFALTLYTILTASIMFARGALSQGSGHWAQRIKNWDVDGYIISILAIAFFFFLFTATLLVVHCQLSTHNLTSIEQRGINSMRTREGALLRKYYTPQGEGGALGCGPLAALRRYRARHRLLRAWNTRWGSPQSEGNPWWIQNADELDYALYSEGALAREAHLRQTLGLACSAAPTARAANVADHAGAPLLAHRSPPLFSRPSSLLNMELSLGPPLQWFRLHFPLNPRYTLTGEWQPREHWPTVARRGDQQA